MTVVAASTLPAGYIKIGPVEFGDDVPARCVVVVKCKSKRKVDKKAVDGKSDGTTTDKGREPADIEIDLSWNAYATNPDGSSVNAAVEEALYQIGPRGPNGGIPQQAAFKRSRVHGVDAIEVEELDGPNDVPGTDLVTAKLKGASWSKPAQTGPGAATTPLTAETFAAAQAAYQRAGADAAASGKTAAQAQQAANAAAQAFNKPGGAPAVVP